MIVAFSGGADSAAMAQAAAELARREQRRIGAVIVDHQLQRDSALVAADAAARATFWGLAPVVVKQVQVGRAGGLENAARNARYDALTQAAHEIGAQAVLLAHTRDDQAETVLMGLVRGGSPRAVAGMAPVRGIFRRPWLAFTRAQLLAAFPDPDAWQDPHNQDVTFTRVKVRTQVLPELSTQLGRHLPSTLARFGTLLQEEVAAVDFYADQLWRQAQVSTKRRLELQDAIGLRWTDLAQHPVCSAADIAPLVEHPRAVMSRVLVLAAGEAGVVLGALRHQQVQQLAALVTDWHGQGPLNLPGSVSAVRISGTVSFCCDNLAQFKPVEAKE